MNAKYGAAQASVEQSICAFLRGNMCHLRHAILRPIQVAQARRLCQQEYDGRATRFLPYYPHFSHSTALQ